jgi:HlyD family secretion protein
MSRKSYTYTAIVVVAGIAGLWWYQRGDARDLPAFRTATIERTNLQSTVSATGALNAVKTVQVGTQVSGQVSAIYADFNDHVKKGQLLARIDPTLLVQAVRDAEAGLERNNADRDNAQRNFDRDKALYDKKVLTEAEYQTSQYQLAVAQANVKSANVSLERARRNLSYTEIYAPIDGVVIERNVDVGQTVAASLQAPQLFLIANDLSRMEILARVDESDIGAIHEGQVVRFTVQPYQGQTFHGTVRQVRLQSTTTENVVNYTVVVSVPNESAKLLPGMTATVSFITGTADSALVVPNGALRFRPTPDMIAPDGEATAASGNAGSGATMAEGSVPSDSARRARRAAVGAIGADSAGRAARIANMSRLWVMGSTGKLRAIPVMTGLSDGQFTVVRGRQLQEGMSIVLGAALPSATTESPSASPFQSSTSNGRRGPPGPF